MTYIEISKNDKKIETLTRKKDLEISDFKNAGMFYCTRGERENHHEKLSVVEDQID